MFIDLNRSKMTKLYITLTMLCLLALPAFGQSSLSPAHGYDVATWLPDFPNIGAFDFSDTLFFLNDGDTIHMLDINSGVELKKFGEPEDYAENFVSFLTLSPDGNTIWTGYTNYGGVDDRIYSIDVETGRWEHQASFPGNWDLVFWKDSILVSGLNSTSWDAPAAIFVLDTTGANLHRRIIEPGGYSAGIAVDAENNLYYGTSYALDPNALYRWDEDTLQAVIEDPGQAVLLVSDGEKLTDLPGGVYDCQVDEGGHVLFNMNLDGGVQAVCKWNGIPGDGEHIDTLATASGDWDWLGNIKSYGDISLTEPGNMVVTYSFGQPLAMLTHLSTLGSVKYDAPEISVYPNPFNESFTIQSGHQDIIEVYVYNLLGDLVLSIINPGPGAEIDLSDQPAGSYILQMRDQKGRSSIIIQKL
jgi:hypothetical protein